MSMQPSDFVIWACAQPSTKSSAPPSEEEWQEFRSNLSAAIGCMVADRLACLSPSKLQKLDSLISRS